MDGGRRTAQVVGLMRGAMRAAGRTVDLTGAMLEYAALLLVWSVLQLVLLILRGPPEGRPGR